MASRPPDTLPALCAAAAARWPTRTALVFDPGGRRLTFAEVEAESNRLAHALIAEGVAPGDRVALMARNEPAFPLTWLAILKAGAIMVPVNVFYRSEDAGYLLDHAGVMATVAARDLAPIVEATGKAGRLLIADEETGGEAPSLPALAAKHDPAPPAAIVTAEMLANIQYTSGTTGKPKGVMQSHAMWVDFARRVAGLHDGLGPDDVLLTAQPFYYMDPQWYLATALFSGATLVVLDRFHPSTFWERVRAHRVTWFYCLGVMPKLLIKQPAHPDDRNHRVRRVLCSAIPAADHAAIEARWGVPWFEAFGMTETGIDIVVPLAEHDAALGRACLGRPVAGREARIHGPEDRPAPRGEAGELVLRGTGMMDGYYRDEAATEAAFRGGWLHTGDLARMDDEGRIYFVGRKKDMIRRSGENIAAAEVEAVLMQHAAVRLAACVPVPDDLRGEEVKAFVVLQPEARAEDVPPDALKAFCAERLAYFKVPRYWAYRDDLPRTPSERVVKSALAAENGDPRAGTWDAAEGVWR